MTPKLSSRGARRGREQRHVPIPSLEVRSSEDAGSPASVILTGYACVTGRPYEMNDAFGDYNEVVDVGAFQGSLTSGDDVRLLVNHEGIALARTKSGTLELREVTDPKADPLGQGTTGLWVRADLDGASPLVAGLCSAMSRGDMDQMSFAFQVREQTWSPDYQQRNIHDVKVFDVSGVTYPASSSTSMALSERMQRVTAALSEKRALDPEDVNMLTQTLGWLTTIDNIVDDGQDTLAAYLGVPNPDMDDTEAVRSMIGRLQKRLDTQTSDGIASLYRAKAALLDLR